MQVINKQVAVAIVGLTCLTGCQVIMLGGVIAALLITLLQGLLVMFKFTDQILVKLYLEFTNNFLSISAFADHMNANATFINEEKPECYWVSIVNRGRIAFNKASNIGFDLYCDKNYSTNNSKYFRARFEQRLLAEHSA